MKLKPNKKRIKLWIAALRSGKYQQVTGTMRKKLNTRGYGYCCLGVAQNLYRRETGKNANFGSGFLSKRVTEWLGFDWNNPMISPQHSAIHANDYLEMTFTEIAAALEETYVNPTTFYKK